MVVYLTSEQLIAINAAQEGGVGVQSPDGVAQNAARPQAGFGGYEKFPDLWTKAAAYAHGIASTQYFTDGNKRTAWFAATIFLRANGIVLPQVSDIEAEAFIHAVALDGWKSDHDPDATVEKAAEWFQSTWDNQRVGPAIDPRLEYCYLALGVEEFDPGCPSVLNSGLHTITHDGSYPLDLHFSVVGRLHWDRIDPLIPHQLDVRVTPDAGYKRITNNHETSEFPPIPPSGHSHHHRGLMPTIFWQNLAPKVRQDCSATVEVNLDGELIARIPFKVLRV